MRPLPGTFNGYANYDVLPYREKWPTRIQVTRPLIYTWPDALGVVHSLTVPVGFCSDGASIPRWAHTLIGHPFDARWVRSALIHDLRCSFHIGSWQDTHDMFAVCMEVEGNRGWRKAAMHKAVWYRGPRWSPWDDMTLADANELVRTMRFTWNLGDKQQ